MEQPPNPNNEKPMSPEDRILGDIRNRKTPKTEEALRLQEMFGKLGHNVEDDAPENELEIEVDKDDMVNWVLRNFNEKAKITEANIKKLEKMIGNLRKKNADIQEMHGILMAKKEEILGNQDEYKTEDLNRYATALIDTLEFNDKFIANLELQLKNNREVSTRVKTPELMNPSDN